MLTYIGTSLANKIPNPLGSRVKFCSPEELTQTKIGHAEFKNFLSYIHNFDFVEEVTLISTCNRFEVIAELVDAEQIDLLENAILEFTKSPVSFSKLTGKDARLQIMRTYSGLNSGLVGEQEVCMQFTASFKQGFNEGFVADKLMQLFTEVQNLRSIINEQAFVDGVSYCQVALNSAIKHFMGDRLAVQKCEDIVLLGSGSTTRNSCLALLELGVKAEQITVVHRASSNSKQMESLKATPGLQNISTLKCKHGYHMDKVKAVVKDADLVIFGIDTKEPVLALDTSFTSKVIDFNSSASVSLLAGFDKTSYISGADLDEMVRVFSRKRIQEPAFSQRIDFAEALVQATVNSMGSSLCASTYK